MSILELGLKKDTLAAQLVRRLLDLIASEGLRAGDLAPSEVQICQDYNVSRGTVREAYRSLAAFGVLEIESGKRPRVRGLDATVLKQVFGFALRAAYIEASQVIQLRRLVEIEVARLAAVNGTPEQFAELEVCVRRMRDARDDHRKIVHADVDLHIILSKAAGNPLFTLMIEGLRGPLEDSMAEGLRGQQRVSGGLADVFDAHDALVSSVRARDSDGAARAMERHFEISVDAILRQRSDADVPPQRNATGPE